MSCSFLWENQSKASMCINGRVSVYVACDLKLNINEQWNLDLDHCASHTPTIPKGLHGSRWIQEEFQDWHWKINKDDTSTVYQFRLRTTSKNWKTSPKRGDRPNKNVKHTKKHRRQDQNLVKPMSKVDAHRTHAAMTYPPWRPSWHPAHD